MIRSCCGAYELLFFNISAKKQDPSGASNTVGTDWASHSVKFGWRVEGIYLEGTDGTHINVVEESKDHSLIATGDDFGLINIYRNPCRPKHQARSYRGHSEFVSNVRFADEGKYMLSTGGEDKTVI